MLCHARATPASKSNSLPVPEYGCNILQRWYLLHDDAQREPASLRAFWDVQLAAKEQGLQIVWPVFLLHQVVQCVVPLVLPHQPQRLLRAIT